MKIYTSGSYREIRNVTWHKDYDPKTFLNDIALVELKTPFKLSALVKPACLPNSKHVKEYEGVLMVSVRVLVRYGLAFNWGLK